jgi:hypothetical protein
MINLFVFLATVPAMDIIGSAMAGYMGNAMSSIRGLVQRLASFMAAENL